MTWRDIIAQLRTRLGGELLAMVSPVAPTTIPPSLWPFPAEIHCSPSKLTRSQKSHHW